MPEAPLRHVFVYGTLRRGGRNDINRLEPAPRYLGMGEVKGALYHFGLYPGLSLGGEPFPWRVKSMPQYEKTARCAAPNFLNIRNYFPYREMMKASR